MEYWTHSRSRRRYSASYTMVTAGTSGAFVAIVYIFTDVLQHRTFLKISQPFVWLGLNSMTGDLHNFLCQHGSCAQELMRQACPGLHCFLQIAPVASASMIKLSFGDPTSPLSRPCHGVVTELVSLTAWVMLAVYVGDEILERALPLVYWGRRGNNLLGLIQWVFHVILGDGWFCSLVMALADVAFWTAVAGLLHRRKWYLKV